MMVISLRDADNGRAAVIELDGPLNSSTSRDFEDYVGSVVGKYSIIVLDASGMDYISSEGIGMIFLLNRRIRERGGSLSVSGSSGEVLSLFSMLGFDSIIDLSPDPEEAIARIKAAPAVKSRQTAAASPAAAEPSAVAADETGKTADSFIIECQGCKSLIRIKGDGDYICPECSAMVTVGRGPLPPGGKGAKEKGGNFIIECPFCKSLLSVAGAGFYTCDSCKKSFTVKDDLKVVFG